MLQTAPLKVPVKPSYVKFAKGTPSARFLKFCKVGTSANYCKKKARKKHPGANAIMSYLEFLWSANLAEYFAANRAS